MDYIGTAINPSPTIVGKAGADIKGGSFLAAAYDDDGNIAIANATTAPIGLLAVETNDTPKGADVAVQVKDIGLWKTGAAVKAGAHLTSDANGKATTATAGKYILSLALEAATAADQVIQVQIINAGFMPATN